MRSKDRRRELRKSGFAMPCGVDMDILSPMWFLMLMFLFNGSGYAHREDKKGVEER